MNASELKRVARALQRKNFTASVYDSGTNFGSGILDYSTNTLYFNVQGMPEAWAAVAHRALNPAAKTK